MRKQFTLGITGGKGKYSGTHDTTRNIALFQGTYTVIITRPHPEVQLISKEIPREIHAISLDITWEVSSFQEPFSEKLTLLQWRYRKMIKAFIGFTSYQRIYLVSFMSFQEKNWERRCCKCHLMGFNHGNKNNVMLRDEQFWISSKYDDGKINFKGHLQRYIGQLWYWTPASYTYKL